MFSTGTAVFTSWLRRRLVLMPCPLSRFSNSLEPSIQLPRIGSSELRASNNPLLRGLNHSILATGSLWERGVAPLRGEQTAATTSWLWFPVVVSTLALANRFTMVKASIFAAYRILIEMVLGYIMTKVSLSISAHSNLANSPILTQPLRSDMTQGQFLSGV